LGTAEEFWRGRNEGPQRKLRTSSDPEAAEAVALFVYRIVREVGSLAAALGGLDAIIFTGGIGENDAGIRANVAQGCQWLGLELDKARNEGGRFDSLADLCERIDGRSLNRRIELVRQ